MASFRPGKQIIFTIVVIGAIYGLYVYASTTSLSKAPDGSIPAAVSDKVEVSDVEAAAETKDEEPVAPQLVGIVLNDNGGGNVSWLTNGTSAQGYKLVWSKTSGPTYPSREGDLYVYYSDPSTTTGKVTAFDGDGAYFVRVCEYLGGACGVYSNEISLNLVSEKKVEKPAEDKETPASDVSSITASGSGSTVTWSVDGYSEKGFKVVWSKTSGPTYPTRSSDRYQYFSDPTLRAATLDAFDGEGTYFVRVCEYLGGACGIYSNEIQVDL